MLASLIYTLCLLYSPPTPPVYQGVVMPDIAGRVMFARTNSADRIEGSEAFMLIGISDKDRQIFAANPGSLLQLVARETSCHEHRILRVSWYNIKAPKK